jgi:hypothetical protein
MAERTAAPAPTEAGMAAFRPWGQFGTVWAEAMADAGAEVLHFVAERVRQDIRTQHRLLHAKDVGEFRHIQAEFVQKAIDQYTAETGRLVEISAEMGRRLGLPQAD